MSSILLISGSPAITSRSAAVLTYAQRRLAAAGLDASLVSIRDFPADDLVLARYDSPSFTGFAKQVAAASALIVATPVYKAAYAGGLKALLDILPQTAFRGKTVLGIATGGSPAHQLVLDFSLKPLFSALGASDLHQGVYLVDKQVTADADGTLAFSDPEIASRLDAALDALAASARTRAPVLA
jgi:FMN reductase